MRRVRVAAVLLAAAPLLGQPAATPVAATPAAGPPAPPLVDRLHAVVENHLGRPYVWGATGLKGFDCSGFLWRVWWDSGVFVKRTTARKFFMALPEVPEGEKWSFPTVVFFDDLDHVGIVDDPDHFFHSALTKGTHRTSFDPFWRRKIYGFRAAPLPTPAR